MGHAYANYFNKAYIVSYRKMPKKKKFHRLISWQNPVKVKKNTPKKSDNVNPVPAASTAGPCPAIIGLLLRFYDNV